MLPILLLVVVGMVGLVDLIVAEQMLSEASGRGARIAAFGGTDDQVQEAVKATLGPDRTDHAKIYVVRTTADQKPIPQGGMIEVRIELDVRHATTTRLAPINPDEVLVGRAVMPRE